VEVLFRKLDPRALDPRNAYGDDAGWDLFVLEDTYVSVNSGVDVRTGIAVALPPGFYARVVGRSSALRKKGLLIIEGIIDQGFRGELFSYAYCPPMFRSVNQGGVMLKAGESVCQVIVQEAKPMVWTELDELPDSIRGERGFGSSDEEVLHA